MGQYFGCLSLLFVAILLIYLQHVERALILEPCMIVHKQYHWVSMVIQSYETVLICFSPTQRLKFY